jgi:taurine dioxygenase
MDDRLSSKLATLEQLGAGAVDHSHKTLLSHFIGTYEILKSWDQPQALCDAGLFHSVYGTEQFPSPLVDVMGRERLRAELGARAEELVHLFFLMNRDDFYEGRVVDRFDRGVVPVSPETFRDLCHLLAANWLEQGPRLHSPLPRQFSALYAQLCPTAREALGLSPPRQYRRIAVEPTKGQLGATLSGVDLANVSGEVFEEIHDAWLEHLVVFFRDQRISSEQYVAFARRFGEIFRHPHMGSLPDHPEIAPVIKEPDNDQNFGPGWHTDSPYLAHPPTATMLFAVEVPERGGDTMFSNMYLAYDTLDDAFKAAVECISAVHTSTDGYAYYRSAAHGMDLAADADDTAEHPIVRTHPETGRKCLYLSPSHAREYHATGLAEDVLTLVVAVACQNAVRDELTYRFQWTPGTLAIWDNRCTMHRALNDYHGHRREMHRLVIRGAAPP